MATVTTTIETEYNRGDIVIFRALDHLLVGVIESFYVDNMAGDSVWYDIRVNHKDVFCFSNHGDIAEYDIIGLVEDSDLKTACEGLLCADSLEDHLSL